MDRNYRPMQNPNPIIVTHTPTGPVVVGGQNPGGVLMGNPTPANMVVGPAQVYGTPMMGSQISGTTIMGSQLSGSNVMIAQIPGNSMLPGTTMTIPGSTVLNPISGSTIVTSPGCTSSVRMPDGRTTYYYPQTHQNSNFFVNGFPTAAAIRRKRGIIPLVFGIFFMFSGIMMMSFNNDYDFWSKFNRSYSPTLIPGIVMFTIGIILVLTGSYLLYKEKSPNGHVYSRGDGALQQSSSPQPINTSVNQAPPLIPPHTGAQIGFQIQQQPQQQQEQQPQQQQPQQQQQQQQPQVPNYQPSAPNQTNYTLPYSAPPPSYNPSWAPTAEFSDKNQGSNPTEKREFP